MFFSHQPLLHNTLHMFLVCVIICNVLLHWGRNLTDWQGSESGIPVLPKAECHSQLVECSLLTWQLNPPELEYCPWQHHSPPQTKKEPEPSKGLDDESRWWTRTRLWSPGQVRFISERVPGLWDAQSLLFVVDFNEPGLAAVLLTMRPPGARGPGAGNDGPPCRIRGAGNDDPPWPNEDSPVALGGGIEWNLSVASRKNRRSKFQI